MTHDPSVSTSSTVYCAQTAPLDDPGPDGEQRFCASLADLEQFTAALRRLGAGDDLAIPGTANLSVTLER